MDPKMGVPMKYPLSSIGSQIRDHFSDPFGRGLGRTQGIGPVDNGSEG